MRAAPLAALGRKRWLLYSAVFFGMRKDVKDLREQSELPEVHSLFTAAQFLNVFMQNDYDLLLHIVMCRVARYTKFGIVFFAVMGAEMKRILSWFLCFVMVLTWINA